MILGTTIFITVPKLHWCFIYPCLKVSGIFKILQHRYDNMGILFSSINRKPRHRCSWRVRIKKKNVIRLL